MTEKFIRKFLFVGNLLISVICFFISVSFFTSNEKPGFILAVILTLVTGGQYYIQKLETLKSKIIATIISLSIFMVVIEIAYRLNI